MIHLLNTKNLSTELKLEAALCVFSLPHRFQARNALPQWCLHAHPPTVSICPAERELVHYDHIMS